MPDHPARSLDLLHECGGGGRADRRHDARRAAAAHRHRQIFDHRRAQSPDSASRPAGRPDDHRGSRGRHPDRPGRAMGRWPARCRAAQPGGPEQTASADRAQHDRRHYASASNSTGTIIRPLDEDDVRRKLKHLIDRGARAIVVSLLWSIHELRRTSAGSRRSSARNTRSTISAICRWCCRARSSPSSASTSAP